MKGDRFFLQVSIDGIRDAEIRETVHVLEIMSDS